MTASPNCSPSRRAGLLLLALCLSVLGGCASAPTRHTEDLCKVFAQHPDWYDAARRAQKRWGTPIPVLMAFVKRESAFRRHARPARHWFLFVPLPRKSSAYGYAQIQDPAWRDYKEATGGLFKSRSDMDDALDFVGWYTDRIHHALGIPQWDARRLYLAYHEGIAGYRSGHWTHDGPLLRTAGGVADRARQYAAQLKRCERQFRCRHWYQLFCH